MMKKNKQSLMKRRDIPFAQRMALQHLDEVKVNRDRAAQIAMFCTSIALHEVAGVGYKRLVKYSIRFKDIMDEFYNDDLHVSMAHAKHRLEQIGIPISDDFIGVDAAGKSKKDAVMEAHKLQAVQIAMICGAIAMHDEFGFAQERQSRITKRVAELADRYAREGRGFLLDEMGKIGFTIANGTAYAYVDEDGNATSPNKVSKKEGISNV